MRYVIWCIFSSLLQLPVKAEDTVTPEVKTIQVERGDHVTYPQDAEPVEVEALMNGLFYSCTVMPGDSFEIGSIHNRSNGISEISIWKIEGKPGDQKICHVGSAIYHVTGTYETIKTKEGFPKIITKLFYPFVFEPDNLEDAQIRKNHEMEDFPSTVKTVLFREDDVIVYPLDAKPVEIEIRANNLDFSCIVAPGDSFIVANIVNHSIGRGKSAISFRKVGGKPGDQEICPLMSWIPIMIEECKLIRTAEGIPESVNCRLSLENLFDTREREEEAETEESWISSWFFNLIE